MSSGDESCGAELQTAQPGRRESRISLSISLERVDLDRERTGVSSRLCELDCVSQGVVAAHMILPVSQLKPSQLRQ